MFCVAFFITLSTVRQDHSSRFSWMRHVVCSKNLLFTINCKDGLLLLNLKKVENTLFFKDKFVSITKHTIWYMCLNYFFIHLVKIKTLDICFKNVAFRRDRLKIWWTENGQIIFIQIKKYFFFKYKYYKPLCLWYIFNSTLEAYTFFFNFFYWLNRRSCAK